MSASRMSSAEYLLQKTYQILCFVFFFNIATNFARLFLEVPIVCFIDIARIVDYHCLEVTIVCFIDIATVIGNDSSNSNKTNNRHL
jgi:hypothetical protein